MNDNIDSDVKKRLEKGRARHENWKPLWAEPLAFIEGRQFIYRSRSGTTTRVNELETTEGGAKPSHRARTVRNRVVGYWATEVSMGTQRVPTYDVLPTSTDPGIISAARLGEKVLLALHDRLEIRKKMVHTYGYAVGTGEGFVRPYWHSGLGDMTPDGYEGDIALGVYGPQELFWEAGLPFERSRWLGIDRAMTPEEVEALPGFIGGKEALKPDANSHPNFVSGAISNSSSKAEMVMVTEYLELPSEKHPEGRRLIIAHNNVICEQEPYPCTIVGPEGPEHCVIKCSYLPTPWRDRDMGLIEHLVDPQRTLNDCINKAIEWKNLLIHPKYLAPVGAFRDRPVAEPGGVDYYNPVSGLKPEIVQPPPIPESLFKMAEQAISDMEEISSQRGVPANIDSAKALSTWIERDQIRRQFVIQALADFHSKLGTHLLHLVQKYYTEERTARVQGRRGLEYIQDFKGADLKDQLDVRVLPGSIEPRTRQAIEQKVLGYADRQWISPQQAMAAIEGGYAEDLVDDYELDVARQQRENLAMQAIAHGGMDVPEARPYDNHDIHLHELHLWMKTREFELSPDEVQLAAMYHEQQHEELKMQEVIKQQEQQMQMAQDLGMQNAARPQSAEMPSGPGGRDPNLAQSQAPQG